MERFDVIVVGGGVAGASCAFHLAERGVERVLVLEKTHLAAGSSGRSAAFIETLYTDADRVRWTQYSSRLYERLEVPFVQRGKLQLARTDAQLARYSKTLELRNDDGARLVEPQEIAALAPRVRVDDLAGAVFGPRDGWVDPPRLCDRLVAGTDVRRGEARSVAAGRVETDQGSIEAGTVVLAGGAWARTLGERAGLDVPVDGHRRTIGLLEDTEAGAGDTPLVVDPVGDDGDSLYLRGDGGRLVLAGFHSENPQLDEPVDPDAYRESFDEPDELAELLADRWRDPAALRWRTGWAGLYPLTPDGDPILGEAAPGIHLLAGLGGNGIQLAGALGRIAADLILDGSSELLPDPARYALARFEA